jgi:hypothetical protein
MGTDSNNVRQERDRVPKVVRPGRHTEGRGERGGDNRTRPEQDWAERERREAKRKRGIGLFSLSCTRVTSEYLGILLFLTGDNFQ